MTEAELLAKIDHAQTPWEAALALLRFSNSRPWWRRLGRDEPGDPHSAWSTIHLEASLYFRGRLEQTPALSEDDRRKLEYWLRATDPIDFDRSHAIAAAIDDVGFETFPAAWRDQVSPDRQEYVLEPGAPYPLGQLRGSDIAHAPFTTHWSSSTDPRKHELSHIRFFAQPDTKWLDEVVVNFAHWDRLETLFSSLNEVATVHPNEHIGEWQETDDGTSFFPVSLHDPDRQVERIRSLLAHVRATDLAARLVVAPELAATEQVVRAVQEDLDQAPDGRALVVVGSEHRVENGKATNRAYALLPNRRPLEHDKIVPMRRRRGRRGQEMVEGISPSRTLRLYQAGRFRYALLICKDFLDDDLLQLLCRLGTNVVTVPAMSPKTRLFRSSVQRLVDTTQAIAVVANGPYRWELGAVAAPLAVFGQPVEPAPLAEIAVLDGCCTGCAWFVIGSRAPAANWVPIAL